MFQKIRLFQNVYDPAFMRKVKKTLSAYAQSMEHSPKKGVSREAFVDIDEKGPAWYLGHMRSAALVLAEKIKEADFVLEIRDARLPFTTENPELSKLIGDTPRLIVFNKAELANENYSHLIHDYYERQGAYVLFTDARRCWRDIVEVVQRFSTHVLPQQLFKTTAHVGLVVGMPNVGKSTLINSLRLAHEYQFHREDYRRSRTPETVAITPGTTRALKMVPISKNPNVVLYDSPGVTLPGCFSKEAGVKLAACGIVPMNDLTLPRNLVARYLFDLFRGSGCLGHLAECLLLSRTPITFDDCMSMICERSGSSAATDMGNLESSRAELFFIHDFQMGNLGRLTLDILPRRIERANQFASMHQYSLHSGRESKEEKSEECSSKKSTEPVWHHVTTSEVVDRYPDYMRDVMNTIRGDAHDYCSDSTAQGKSRRKVSSARNDDFVISRKKGPISRASNLAVDSRKSYRLAKGR